MFSHGDDRQHDRGQHCRDRLWPYGFEYWRKPGLCFVSPVSNRVLATLRFLWKKLANHRGFFYHWADVHTGERIWDSEISLVDTAILLCGVLTARAHFNSREDYRAGQRDF